jgi:organic radical activating enzyme
MDKVYYDLKVGFSCNNDCIHCVVADKRNTKDLTTQQIKDIINLVPSEQGVVFTGGEPLLQLDDELIAALHHKGFDVAIETNGTLKVPKGIDWVCVSPKAGSELIVLQADELKLVIPQNDHHHLEKLMARFEGMDYRNRFLQPMDGPSLKSNTALAVSLCQKRPLWRLSLQSHKLIGIR